MLGTTRLLVNKMAMFPTISSNACEVISFVISYVIVLHKSTRVAPNSKTPKLTLSSVPEAEMMSDSLMNYIFFQSSTSNLD